MTPDLISEVVKSAKRNGSGVAAVKITDTIKEVETRRHGIADGGPDKLMGGPTPQAFRYEVLVKAMEYVRKKNLTITDDAAAVELFNQEVHLFPPRGRPQDYDGERSCDRRDPAEAVIGPERT